MRMGLHLARVASTALGWIAFIAILVPCASAHEIGWRVVQPFPLIPQAAYEDLKKSWEALPTPRTMHGFILARMAAKAAAGNRHAYLLTDPEPVRERLQSHLNDRKPIEVQLRIPGAAGCVWSVSPPPPGPPVDGSCDTTMLATPDMEFMVSVRVAAEARPVAPIKVQVKDLLIVAMGDSYSSGEGAPDRPAIYANDFPEEHLESNDWFMRGPAPQPAVWLDRACHRSLLSWQVLAALKLALDHHDVVVRLLHTACSGAEFLDGIFLAQLMEKVNYDTLETESLRARLVRSRDGEGRHTPATPDGWYLRHSQVNAVRRALCPATDAIEDILIGADRALASRMQCTRLPPTMQPDALLLTAGGNDLKFAGAVSGLLFPETARLFPGQPFLSLFRMSLGYITPKQLTENIEKLAPDYSGLVDQVAQGALTTKHKTVLLVYPNPVGPEPKEEKCRHDMACRLSNACYQTAIQERISRANYGLSVFADRNIPVGGPWVVEITKAEVLEFMQHAYPALQKMIRQSPAVAVEWLAASRLDGHAGDYDTRLVCTDELPGTLDRMLQLEQEPLYFCQQTARGALPDRCVAKKLKHWNSESPHRRLTNSANDALLAQRSFGAAPERNEVAGAIRGTFHPTAEAYAVAADSAYMGLCKVLAPRSVCMNPYSMPMDDEPTDTALGIAHQKAQEIAVEDTERGADYHHHR